jgi:hypothetical protein
MQQGSHIKVALVMEWGGWDEVGMRLLRQHHYTISHIYEVALGCTPAPDVKRGGK